MRFLIFLSRQSRYAPPRIGGFSFNPIFGKYLYLGRSLTANEFNDACEEVFVKKRGIPGHATISCQAVSAEEEKALTDRFNAPPAAPAPAQEPEPETEAEPAPEPEPEKPAPKRGRNVKSKS